MHIFRLAVVGAVLIAMASATSASTLPVQQSFHHLSRARMISVGDKICGPHGNPRLCCLINDSVWHLIPAPPHCVWM